MDQGIPLDGFFKTPLGPWLRLWSVGQVLTSSREDDMQTGAGELTGLSLE